MESLYKEKRATDKLYEFRPSQNWSEVNSLFIDGQEYKIELTFESVFGLLKLFSYDLPYKFKVKKAFEVLGLDIEPNEYILNEISTYIFKNSKSAGERVFDYDLDFKYYYHDFKDAGIDLLKDKLSWWEFDTRLEAIMLKGNSAISKVLEFRTYKRPNKVDKYNMEEVKFYEKKKREYALPQAEMYTEKNIGGLWNYVEKKAGGKND